MKELSELLNGVEIHIDTAFGIITLNNIIPAMLGNDGKRNLLDLYGKLLGLKNE